MGCDHFSTDVSSLADGRSFAGTATQAGALSPDILATIV